MGAGRSFKGHCACLAQTAGRDQFGERALAGDRVQPAVLADDGDTALVLVFVRGEAHVRLQASGLPGLRGLRVVGRGRGVERQGS
ncbi:hypothetical protein GCM10017771_82130 [Streptomyces capitiformicae]|uniref:Uncharacterized protein n=1 Tax=Streptomyces capitiformicae TaxID=2014920 RepID=A0A918ZMP9_9ACTN|nr:hypothetical protein GCM10017771_82130 [Streptomyces capitiformicae]